MLRFITVVFLAVVLVTDLSAEPTNGWLKSGDVVVEDFEGKAFKVIPASTQADSSGWRSTGLAFSQPWRDASTAAPSGAPLSTGYAWACGEKLICSSPDLRSRRIPSLSVGGQATGTLTSPAFSVQKGYLCFLIGGARNPQAIAVQLLHDGQVVRSVTGTGQATSRMVAFDMRQFLKKTVQIRLVDQLHSVDGFLVVDRFVQTDKPPTSEVIADVAPQAPGVVRTFSGVMKGQLALRGDQLTVGGKAVPLQTLLSLNNAVAVSGSAADSGIRLRNGELWAGQIKGYAAAAVELESAFGVRKVKLSEISSLIFDGDVPFADEAPGTLYRRGGDPIPGKLVWIKSKDLALSSLLGILPIPRNKLARFVVQPVNAKVGSGLVEFGLVDGSILYSKTLKIKNGRFQMQHPVLGEFKLGSNQITYLRRRTLDTVWLAGPTRTKAVGIIGAGVKPFLRDAGQSGGQVFQQALRLPALSSATYDLPAAFRKGATLRGTLMPLSNSRAKLRVSLQAAGKTVWQTKLEPGGDPVEVNLRFPPCKDFSIAVAYDGKVAVPGGAEWLDAHLLLATAVTKRIKGL